MNGFTATVFSIGGRTLRVALSGVFSRALSKLINVALSPEGFLRGRAVPFAI